MEVPQRHAKEPMHPGMSHTRMQDAFLIRAGELILLDILVTSQIFGSSRQPSVCAGVGECAHAGALLPVGVLTNVVSSLWVLFVLCLIWWPNRLLVDFLGAVTSLSGGKLFPHRFAWYLFCFYGVLRALGVFILLKIS